jgi:PAS domain S-box-containing protein
MENGRTFGILTIYSASLDAFDAEEVRLLGELAGDMAYGIQALRTRAAHERALTEIEILARFPGENPNPVLRVREDGTILYANAPSAPLLRLWDSAVGDRMPAEWIARIRHGLETRAQERLDLSCDDRVYSIVLTPIPDGGYVNLYGRDITDRKRAEEAREKSERTVRAMFDGARDGILLAETATRRFVNANPAMCRMLGYSREEIERLSVADIHPPDRLEYVSAEFEKQLRGEPILARDIPVTRKDGSVFLADVNSSPLELDGRLHLLGIFRDITNRKRLEEERIELEVRVRQQQKLEAIGILASGVAHEINNPINGIMNYAQLIADTVEPGSPAAAHAAEILAETARVATIVRNLLQFARQETQTHSPARLADIVEQTLSLLRAVFRRDQITLTVDVPEGLPTLKCRSQQLQQVIMNLLTNARDALNAKYPGYHEAKTLRITARVLSGISDVPSQGTAVPQSQIANPKSQMADRWLRLTVADQGNGIPPEIQARIFDPFFTTKPRDKGTGLGLSISHGIVKDHHGVLHFETAPGIGTQFHLDLPVDNGWTVEEE